MRKLVVGCGLLLGALLVLAQSPSIHVRAQEKPITPPKPKSHAQSASSSDTSRKVPADKEAGIRQLMDVTGAKNLGEQMMKAGMDQFRASVSESQPDNPRAKQFIDAFVIGFQKHFDPNSLTDKVVPIYDKYLTADDIKGLLDYYQSPLGQRMLKALPEIARESQEVGFALGQKAAQDTFEDLKTEYPEFIASHDDDKRPSGDRKEP